MFRNISTTLYHGSISVIDKVDVSMGRGRKDFGKGFYMSVSKQQAIGMMQKKYREAKRRYFNSDRDDFQEVLYKIELEMENLGIQYFIGKQEVADKIIKSFARIERN